MVFEWFGIVMSEFGREAAMVVALLYGGYKYHRIKSILGSAIGSIGFAATMGVVVLGAVVVASVLDWVALNPGQMFGDLVGGAGVLWEWVVSPVVDMLLGGSS